MTVFYPIHKIARGVVIALSVVALGACSGLNLSADTSGGAAPLIQSVQSPADTVRAFLDSWGQHDYQAMYTRLSANSQALYAFPVFQTTYQDADKTLGTQGVDYTIHQTQEQGDTVAVLYDAEIQSSIFGSVADPGRTMRLVRAPDNTWKIAWSSMDIINGYAAGTRLEVNSQRPPRGNIYDHSGQLMVEQGGEVTGLYVARQDIPDELRCVDLLSVILRRTRADLLDLLGTYNPETVIPLGDVDPSIYNARAAELESTCKIRTDTRTTRRYVGHGIATHLIGYIGSIPAEEEQSYLDNGYSQGDLVGLAGIEQAYESDLAGKSERVLRVIEPGGMIVRELAGTSGQPAHDVTLTLDLNLQWATAQALSDAYNAAANNWASPEHSPGGAAVVIDVNTGAILALASYPTFDPGIFNGDDTTIFQVGNYIADLHNSPASPFSNRATQEQYSPGSTFKIVTLAAAAEEGSDIFDPSTMFPCDMIWYGQDFGDTFPQRYDWRYAEDPPNNFNTGPVTMSEALTASCNPFFYQMGAQLYNKRTATTLSGYARQMGLGTATGLAPIVPEANGDIPVPRAADEAISLAVGQGDTQVTAIQMARMVAGIANGGTLYKPYVVQQVGGEDGSDPIMVATPTVASDMGLSDSTLALIKEGMCAVTTDTAKNRTNGDPLGTAWFVFDQPTEDGGTGVAPYSVCGKTGTAQTARPEPNGWFVAFAPADNPTVAVAVVTQYSREGSETSAPIVRRILDAYFGAQQAPWPAWWTQNPYYEINIPEGSTGG